MSNNTYNQEKVNRYFELAEPSPRKKDTVVMPPPKVTQPTAEETNWLYNTFGTTDRAKREQLKKLNQMLETPSLDVPQPDIPSDEELNDNYFSFKNPDLFAKDQETNFSQLNEGIRLGKLAVKKIDGVDYVMRPDGQLAMARIDEDGIKKINYTEPTKMFGSNLLPIPGTNNPISSDMLNDLDTGRKQMSDWAGFAASPFGIDQALITAQNLFGDDRKDVSRPYDTYFKPNEVKQGSTDFSGADLAHGLTKALGAAGVAAASGGGSLVVGGASAVPSILDNISRADQSEISPQTAVAQSAIDLGAGLLGAKYIPNFGTQGVAKTIGGVMAGDAILGAGRSVIEQADKTPTKSAMDYANYGTAISGGASAGFSLFGSSLAAGGAKIAANKITDGLNQAVDYVRMRGGKVTTEEVMQNATKLKPEATYNPLTNKNDVIDPTAVKETEAMVDATVKATQDALAVNPRAKIKTQIDPITGKVVVTAAADNTATPTETVNVVDDLKTFGQNLPTVQSSKMKGDLWSKKIPKEMVGDVKVHERIVTDNPVAFVESRIKHLNEAGLTDAAATLPTIMKQTNEVINGTYKPTPAEIENVRINNIEQASQYGANVPIDVEIAARQEALAYFYNQADELTRKLTAISGDESEGRRQAVGAILKTFGGDNLAGAAKKFSDAAYKTDPLLLGSKFNDKVNATLVKSNPELEAKLLPPAPKQLPPEYQYQSQGFNDVSKSGVKAVGYNAALLDDVLGVIDDTEKANKILQEAGLFAEQRLVIIKQLKSKLAEAQPTDADPLQPGIKEIDGSTLDWDAIAKAGVFKTDEVVATAERVKYSNADLDNVEIKGIEIAGSQSQLTQAMYIIGSPDVDPAIKKKLTQDVIEQLPEFFIKPADVTGIASKVYKQGKDTKKINVVPYLKPKDVVITGLPTVAKTVNKAKTKAKSDDVIAQIEEKKITNQAEKEQFAKEEYLTENRVATTQVQTETGHVVDVSKQNIADDLIDAEDVGTILNTNFDNIDDATERLVVANHLDNNYGLQPDDLKEIQAVVKQDVETQFNEAVVNSQDVPAEFTLSPAAVDKVKGIVKAKKATKDATPKGKVQKAVKEAKSTPKATDVSTTAPTKRKTKSQKADKPIVDAYTASEQISDGVNVTQNMKSLMYPIMLAPTVSEDDEDSLYASLGWGAFALVGAKYYNKFANTQLGSKITSRLTFDPEVMRVNITSSKQFAADIDDKLERYAMEFVAANPNATNEQVADAVQNRLIDDVETAVEQSKNLFDKKAYTGTTAQKATYSPQWRAVHDAMVDADRYAGLEIKPIIAAIDMWAKETPRKIQNMIIDGNNRFYSDWVELRNSQADNISNAIKAYEDSLEQMEYMPPRREILATKKQIRADIKAQNQAEIDQMVATMFDKYVYTDTSIPRNQVVEAYNLYRDIQDARTVVEISQTANNILLDYDLTSIPEYANIINGNYVTFSDLLQMKPFNDAKMDAYNQSIDEAKLAVQDARYLQQENGGNDINASRIIKENEAIIAGITNDPEYIIHKQVAKVIKAAQQRYDESVNSLYVDLRIAERNMDKNSDYAVSLKAVEIDEFGNEIKTPVHKQPIKYFKRFNNDKLRKKRMEEYLKGKGAVKDKLGNWTYKSPDGRRYKVRKSEFSINADRNLARQNKETIKEVIEDLINTSNLTANNPNTFGIDEKLATIGETISAWKKAMENKADSGDAEIDDILEKIDAAEEMLNELQIDKTPRAIQKGLTRMLDRISTSHNGGRTSFRKLRHTNADGWDVDNFNLKYSPQDYLTSMAENLSRMIGAAEQAAAIRETNKQVGKLKLGGFVDTPVTQSLLDYKTELLASRDVSAWYIDAANLLTQGIGLSLIGFSAPSMFKNGLANLISRGLNNIEMGSSTNTLATGTLEYLRDIGRHRNLIYNSILGNQNGLVNGRMQFFDKTNDLFYDFANTINKYNGGIQAYRDEASFKQAIVQDLINASTFSESIFTGIASHKSGSPVVKAASQVASWGHTPNRAVDIIARVSYAHTLLDDAFKKGNFDLDALASDPTKMANLKDQLFKDINLRINQTYGKFSPLYKSLTEQKLGNALGGALKPFMLFSAPAVVSLMNWRNTLSRKLADVDVSNPAAAKGLKAIGQLGALGLFVGLLGGSSKVPGVNDLVSVANMFDAMPDEVSEFSPENVDPTVVEHVANQTRTWLMDDWGLTAEQSDKYINALKYGAVSAALNRNLSQDESVLNFFDPVVSQTAQKFYEDMNKVDGGFADAMLGVVNKGVIKNVLTSGNNFLHSTRQYKEMDLDDNDTYGFGDFVMDMAFGQPLSNAQTRSDNFNGRVKLSTTAGREQYMRTFLKRSGLNVFSNVGTDKLSTTAELTNDAPLIHAHLMSHIQDSDLKTGMELSSAMIEEVFDTNRDDIKLIIGNEEYSDENAVDQYSKTRQAVKTAASGMYMQDAGIRAWDDYLKSDNGSKILKKYDIRQSPNVKLVNNLINYNVVTNSALSLESAKPQDYGKYALISTLSKRLQSRGKTIYSPEYQALQRIAQKIIK